MIESIEKYGISLELYLISSTKRYELIFNFIDVNVVVVIAAVFFCHVFDLLSYINVTCFFLNLRYIAAFSSMINKR